MNNKKFRVAMNVVTVIGLAIFGIMTLINMNYTYTLSDNAVTITRGKGIVIPFAEIEDVQYFERLPALSNRVGESIGNKKSGTFTVDGVGRGKVYATDATKPAIILFTKDTFYAITPDDAESFFQQVSVRIGK